MSAAMEAALRAEIEWHEKWIRSYDARGHSATADLHRARLALLSAALPAPGADVAGEWVMVPRVATTAMVAAVEVGQIASQHTAREVYEAMLAAAPDAPR